MKHIQLFFAIVGIVSFIAIPISGIMNHWTILQCAVQLFIVSAFGVIAYHPDN